MDGWISLYRKIRENGLWADKPFARGQAWIDLLLLANHKPGHIYIRGNRIDLERGQIGWSVQRLAVEWGWSRGKVQRFLNDLENEHQIEQQKNAISTVITIINYDAMQKTDTYADIRRTSDGHQTDTNNKNNKNNKKNNKHKHTPKPPKGACVFDYENGQFQGIPPSRIQQWSDAYPAVDVNLAIRQAALWAADNPAKKKQDWLRFLTNWMNRTQQRGGNKNELHRRTVAAGNSEQVRQADGHSRGGLGSGTSKYGEVI